METRWLYTTSENFPALVEASKGVCIIPMGCVEKHGLHLPLGQDIIQVSHLAYMASQLETACVFPDFTFGDVPENSPNMPAGSITLPMDMEMALLETLCEQISRNGFKKIIIYNGHGGNSSILTAFLRKLENKYHDFVVGVVFVGLSAPHTLAKEILAKGSESVPEMTKEDIDLILKYHADDMRIGHACFGETAYAMGICPESVRLDRLGIEDGQSRTKADYFKAAGIQIRDGGWGINFPNAFDGDDPIGCNERIGKAALRLEAQRFAHAIRVMKEDENLMKWHKEAWGVAP